MSILTLGSKKETDGKKQGKTNGQKTKKGQTNTRRMDREGGQHGRGGGGGKERRRVRIGGGGALGLIARVRSDQNVRQQRQNQPHSMPEHRFNSILFNGRNIDSMTETCHSLTKK